MDTPKKITAWSFNRLMDFEACAFRSYLDLILKSEHPPVPENSPLNRGIEIHSKIEAYIKGETDVVDKSFQSPRILDEINFCRENNAIVEERWGFDFTWGAVDFFADNVWLRVVLDALVFFDDEHARAYDWKSGKSFGNEVKHTQQGQLYAIATFLKFPKLQHLDVIFAYTDEGKLTTKTYKRDDRLFKLMARWTERGSRMTACVDFKPKPNVMNCKYCKFGPNGTQACAYGVT